MRRTKETFFGWIVAHRGPVAAVGTLVIILAAAQAAQVPTDYAVEQFFPAQGTERRTFDEYKLHFPKEDGQFAVFFEDVATLGTELFLDLQETARLMEDVGLSGIQWFGNMDFTETIELDGEVATRIYRLVDEPDLSDDVVRDVLERHRSNALFRGFLWSDDQSVFAVYGYLDPELKTDELRREVEESLTAALATRDSDRPTPTLVGVPVYRSRIPKMLEVDQTRLLGGGLVLFFGILLYFFRRVGHVLLCLGSVLPAYLCTLAVMGLTGRSISVLTSFIPIIVLVVGVSDAIHLLARYRHDRSELGDNDAAIVRAFSALGGTCFYTSATTALGFFSLIGTRIGIVMEFAVFTALAIMLTYAFSMTLLPALLGFAARMDFDDRGLTPRWILRTVEAAVVLPVRRARSTVLVFSLASAACLLLGLTLRVNTFLLDDMGNDSPVLHELQRLEAAGFGLFQVNVFLDGGGEGDLHDPTMLAWMSDLERFAATDSIVVHTLGLPDLMSELRQAVVDVDGRGIPDSVEEAAQLLFLADLNGGGGVEDVYLQEAGVAQIILTVRDEGSVSMLPFLQRVERYLEDNPPPIGTAAATGTVQMAQTYAARLVETFGPSLVLAIILVFAVMTYMFRSIRLGALAVIPNIFPLVVLMGVMKLGGIDLKPSTILVFSIAFGLAVDDTMHFLSHLRESLARGVDTQSALEASLRSTGPAILMTSVAVGGGFLLLVGSQFQILVLVGAMTAISAVAAVAADMFALPSLIALASRRLHLGEGESPELERP